MDYLKLCLGLVGLFSTFLTWLREKQLLDAGEAKVIARVMQERADEVSKAEAVRASVVARNRSITGSLPDDGFTRHT